MGQVSDCLHNQTDPQKYNLNRSLGIFIRMNSHIVANLDPIDKSFSIIQIYPFTKRINTYYILVISFWYYHFGL